jgi:hypothetical protein
MELALPCALRALDRNSEVLLRTEVLRASHNGPGELLGLGLVRDQIRIVV